jgi:Secretion system C-terminal sorting domain
MKKIYLSISLSCFALINAMGQATTPPNTGRVSMHPITAATSCDGYANFNQGTITMWKWFHDSTLIQTGGTLLDSLCAGKYSVSYIDSLNTNHKDEFTIGVSNTSPGGGSGGGSGGVGSCPGFEAHAVSTNTKSATGCDGTAEVVIVKVGTPPYSYKWGNSTNTDKTRSGLCAGGYAIMITDSAGCTYKDSVHVGAFNAANPCLNFKAHVLPKDETMPGACDGSVEAIPDGGAAPYIYVWSGSNVNTRTEANLCSGMHSLKITDANGCVGHDSATVNSAGVNTKPCQYFAVRTLVVNDTSHTSANACGGYVEAICKGATGPLKYIWSDNSANKTAFHKNTCTGKYTVTVSDSLGCKAAFTAYVGVDHPPVMVQPTPGVMPIRIYVKTMDVSNAALCNGKAHAMVEGGKAPYKIRFGKALATGKSYEMDTLCAGFYTINVMDADSATASFVFVIGSPATTFTPPTPPFVNPVIKDTLVANAIATCSIDYDAIDSIRITHKDFVGADSIKAIWTVFQTGGTNHTVTQFYHMNSAMGICKLVLDLFCTNRVSGNVKAEDYLDLTTVGIQSVESIKTTIYPNPFSDQINVMIDKNSTVSVFDVTGRNVYNGILNAGTSTISTDHLNSGMYFINITSGQKTISKKLIKH